MTIQQWQIVAAAVSAILCFAALFKNRVILSKVAIALGITAIAVLQLFEVPLDRAIRAYEQRLENLPDNSPKRPGVQQALQNARDRLKAAHEKKDPLEVRKARFEKELSSLDDQQSEDAKLLSNQIQEIETRLERTGSQWNWIDLVPVKPGLDLQGGTEVRLRLKHDRRDVEKLEEAIKELETELANAPEGKKSEISQSLKEKQKALEDETAVLEGDFAKAVDVIRERINSSGLSEIPVTRQGKYRVLLQLPGMSEAEADRIIDTLQKQGRLEFRLAVKEEDDKQFYNQVDQQGYTKDTLNISRQTYKPVPDEFVDENGRDSRTGEMLYDWLRLPDTIEGGKSKRGKFLLVEKEIQVTGKHVRRASAQPDPKTGGWQVILHFNTVGSELFRRVTTANVDHLLGIVLDGRLRSAPNINEPISGGQATITGGFDKQEAEQLGVVLKSGSLRVKILREARSFVGPTLGADSIQSGIRAMVLGLGLVVVFMLGFYMIAGVVTNVALLLNMLIIVAALSAWDATMTLPGIAGLILTVGMAVDANVLIFERIREEKDKGNSLVRSIALGYERAFVTIVDANVTTIITALILHSFGTEAVRGFALTLFVGIVTSMFCSLVITRWIFELLCEYNVIKDLKMNRLFSRPQLDFISLRRPAMAISAILIVVGLAFFFSRGNRNYGIDFTGGTLAHIQLDKPLTTAEVRERVQENMSSDFPDAVANLQSFGLDAADGSGFAQFTLRTQFVHPEEEEWNGKDKGMKSADDFKKLIAKTFPELSTEKPFVRFESIGGVVAGEMKQKALFAMIYAIVAIFFYIWLRFQFRASFGAGAVIALVHDVLFTVGALAVADELKLLNGQIDLKIVAALLTIVGYSLNDTIVVFDRVRENMASGGKALKDLINDSLSQTISRTVITSLTTLLVVLCLLILGGDVIRGFAFALFIGVLVGTYSSIFIASPVLVEFAALQAMRQKQKAEAAQQS